MCTEYSNDPTFASSTSFWTWFGIQNEATTEQDPYLFCVLTAMAGGYCSAPQRTNVNLSVTEWNQSTPATETASAHWLDVTTCQFSAAWFEAYVNQCASENPAYATGHPTATPVLGDGLPLAIFNSASGYPALPSNETYVAFDPTGTCTGCRATATAALSTTTPPGGGSGTPGGV